MSAYVHCKFIVIYGRAFLSFVYISCFVVMIFSIAFSHNRNRFHGIFNSLPRLTCTNCYCICRFSLCICRYSGLWWPPVNVGFLWQVAIELLCVFASIEIVQRHAQNLARAVDHTRVVVAEVTRLANELNQVCTGACFVFLVWNWKKTAYNYNNLTRYYNTK